MYFLSFSLYFTHYYVHYLRINLADKMYLLLYWVTYEVHTWKILKNLRTARILCNMIPEFHISIIMAYQPMLNFVSYPPGSPPITQYAHGSNTIIIHRIVNVIIWTWIWIWIGIERFALQSSIIGPSSSYESFYRSVWQLMMRFVKLFWSIDQYCKI